MIRRHLHRFVCRLERSLEVAPPALVRREDQVGSGIVGRGLGGLLGRGDRGRAGRLQLGHGLPRRLLQLVELLAPPGPGRSPRGPALARAGPGERGLVLGALLGLRHAVSYEGQAAAAQADAPPAASAETDDDVEEIEEVDADDLMELDEEHGSFADYLGSHDGFEAQVKDLCKQFKFLGATGSHFFLWVVGEDAPMCTNV